MDEDKALTYEEAKRLCRMAFDGGVTYGESSMRYSCNAVAYDWEHWLKKNEGLFRPKPTVEDVLREFIDSWSDTEGREDERRVMDEYAARLRLAGDDA